MNKRLKFYMFSNITSLVGKILRRTNMVCISNMWPNNLLFYVHKKLGAARSQSCTSKVAQIFPVSVGWMIITWMAVIRPKAGGRRWRLRILSRIGEQAAIQTPVNNPYKQENTRNEAYPEHLEDKTNWSGSRWKISFI